MIWESRFCMPTICINSFPNRLCRGIKPTLLLFSSFFPPAETYSPQINIFIWMLLIADFKIDIPLLACWSTVCWALPRLLLLLHYNFVINIFLSQFGVGLLRSKKNSNQNRQLTLHPIYKRRLPVLKQKKFLLYFFCLIIFFLNTCLCNVFKDK